MGERKVLNKYYPPDFNPSKLPRLRRHKNRQIKVRMMLPMSIRCNTCGNYIYKGTKFNSRKEDTGETYLGKIQIFRFYFKCTRCSAELTIKTDPQNSDYVVESGATRNFEPWRAEDEEAGKKKRKREAEEMGNSMKSLENRTLDSKREMDKIAVLRELKSMKSRQAAVNVDAMLEASQRAAAERQRRLDEEDEALIKSIFSEPKVRRIADEEPDDECESSRLQKNRNKVTSANPTDIQVSSRDNRSNPRKSSNNLPVRILVIKKQATSSSSSPTNQTAKKSEEAKPPEERRTVATNTGLLSICKNYSSDNDDEE